MIESCTKIFKTCWLRCFIVYCARHVLSCFEFIFKCTSITASGQFICKCWKLVTQLHVADHLLHLKCYWNLDRVVIGLLRNLTLIKRVTRSLCSINLVCFSVWHSSFYCTAIVLSTFSHLYTRFVFICLIFNLFLLGGVDAVTNKKMWNKIATKMGWPPKSSIGPWLKMQYDKILYPFDVFQEMKSVVIVWISIYSYIVF